MQLQVVIFIIEIKKLLNESKFNVSKSCIPQK